METDISAYKVHRRQLKASLTRAETFLEKNKAAPDIEQCKVRYEKFSYFYDEFNRIQSKIEGIDESELEGTERDTFEEKYFELEARFRKIIKAGGGQSSERSDTVSELVKLPTIELPKFAGAYEDWLTFYDTFSALIHKNDRIPTIHKFHYLKSCLKGDAANVLHSLEISADNYANAWQMLEDRYSNKRVIVQKHINAIFELPNATKENLNTLRQILDGVQKHSRALESLKRPIEKWDDLLVHIITKKLDSQSFKEWENKIQGTDMPTFKELTNFLTQKCQTLEAIGKPMQSVLANKTSANVAIHKSNDCTFCNGNHIIYQCKSFLSLSVEQRIEKARSKQLCLNCLRTNHIASKCTAKGCRHCSKRHNSLLHYFKSDRPGTSTSVSTHSSNSITTHTMLSTAVVNAFDVRGRKHSCRVLLDSGSQSNLITNRMATILRLQKKSTNVVLSGINQSRKEIPHSVNVAVKSKHNGFQRTINCLVLEKIAEKLPLVHVPREHLKVPKNLRLADPEFNIPRDIDMLIGIELFYHLLCVGQIKLHKDGPFLQKTLFGWIIAGKLMVPETSPNVSICNASTLQSLNTNIKKFWEVETVAERQVHSQEESYCELHFTETSERQIDGRFVVSLPFRENVRSLGGSYEQAIKRFESLERRFKRDAALKQEYVSFMDEYLELGHMRQINNVDREEPHFYLPHHAVVKENSLTTKVRVVFDGSAKSTSGISLNDTLMVGPKLQQDLFDIICRFRLHKYVLTADVAKMYRQVRINEKCMPFQRILWRNSEEKNVETFELTTVTYGTASASYLAIKALQQTALAEEDAYELATKVILRDFYADDLLTGANTLTEAKEITKQVTTVLQKRKWASNDPNNLHFLTPSYLVMGYSPEAIPEPTLTHLTVNSLSRWQHMQYMRDHSWKRWHREYLNQLQRRNKWQRRNGNGLTPGQLVVVKDEQDPPNKWFIGRIIDVFPGHDGVVRTATVSTSQRVTKRPEKVVRVTYGQLVSCVRVNYRVVKTELVRCSKAMVLKAVPSRGAVMLRTFMLQIVSERVNIRIGARACAHSPNDRAVYDAPATDDCECRAI